MTTMSFAKEAEWQQVSVKTGSQVEQWKQATFSLIFGISGQVDIPVYPKPVKFILRGQPPGQWVHFLFDEMFDIEQHVKLPER